MQSSTEIQAQIKQIEREVQDIHGSLPRLTQTQDLLDAHGELTNRANVLGLLRERLQKAQGQEEQQAKLDKRAELERTRDDATAEHAELDSAFESVMQPLEQAVLDALDALDEVALKRQNAEARRSNAVFELRGRQAFGDNGQLCTGFGWFSTATPNARSDVRRVLFELYAARRHIYGQLQLDGQDNGHRGVFGLAPRPQELTQPDPNDALIQQLSAEFAQKRAQNGS